MLTVLLLIGSNVFMTFAWYGHLKFPVVPLWKVIVISWAIAFFEYCLMVPANRYGYGQFTGAQLKTIQEIITLSIFAGFSILYLGEALRWNHLAGFACLVAAAFFMFQK
ncbi:MAG: DMT family protein [Rhodospirillales bacterium]|nr:DMT family protein [Rhodospirillales bacterium]